MRIQLKLLSWLRQSESCNVGSAILIAQLGRVLAISVRSSRPIFYEGSLGYGRSQRVVENSDWSENGRLITGCLSGNHDLKGCCGRIGDVFVRIDQNLQTMHALQQHIRRADNNCSVRTYVIHVKTVTSKGQIGLL